MKIKRILIRILFGMMIFQVGIACLILSVITTGNSLTGFYFFCGLVGSSVGIYSVKYGIDRILRIYNLFKKISKKGKYHGRITTT